MMKKVLYLSSIQDPYRTTFFNQLAEFCDLTVLYERMNSERRDGAWQSSVDMRYISKVIDTTGKESQFKIACRMAKCVIQAKHYDEIILGCCNSIPQMFTYLLLCLFRRAFSMNLDGETFFDDKGIKKLLKKFFIKGASKYYVAGVKSMESLQRNVGTKGKTFLPYYFSSLTEQEIQNNAMKAMDTCRKEHVLVIGRYFDYKGLDIALEAALMTPELTYRFVGMGSRADEFVQLVEEKKAKNVEVIPFLPKDDLEKEYLTCKLLLLPSRRECWGLVVNEAASYGCTIISTIGSGGAVEFLQDDYAEWLAPAGNAEKLAELVRSFVAKDKAYVERYSRFLLEKGRHYSIEANVREYMNGISGL